MSTPNPSVEEALRKAINRSPDQSVEARNRIYLAAREAIEQLPRAQAEPAMHTLFEAVTRIETEFAELELASSPQDTGIPQTVTEPKPVPPPLPRAPRKPVLKLPDLSEFKIPWKAILVLIALLAVMALSAILVWQQFRQEGLVRIDNNTVVAGRPGINDIAEGALASVFAVSGLADAAMLSGQPDGLGTLSPANAGSANASDILLSLPSQIFSREPIQLEKGRFYLLRMRLRIDPSDSKVVMSAGFSAGNNSSAAKPLHTAFVMHDGEIDLSKTRKNGSMLVFSRLFEWEDIAAEIPLAELDGLVRPTVILKSLGESTKIWFNSISVDAI